MKASALGFTVASLMVALATDASAADVDPMVRAPTVVHLTPVATSGNEASIIGNPGEHPDYHLEIEPHGLLAFGGPFNAWHGNLGAGVRASFPLIGNGPIPSVNNNLAIGVGGDFFVFNGAALFVPIVGQWNFFLLSHFSLFLEAGLGITFGGLHYVDPILGVGGRYHITDRLALTVRLEYPALAIGLSIYL